MDWTGSIWIGPDDGWQPAAEQLQDQAEQLGTVTSFSVDFPDPATLPDADSPDVQAHIAAGDRLVVATAAIDTGTP